MVGTNSINGKSLAGVDHLKQSIRDILTTPIGSRVMLRNYGSRLFELVDSPLNHETVTEIYVATIEALEKWEPRIEVIRVIVEAVEAGEVRLSLEAKFRETEQIINLKGVALSV